MSEFDMCVDYKRKFGIKFNKFIAKELSFGIFFCKNLVGTYIGDRYEYYLYISLFKIGISIGSFLESGDSNE